MAVPARQAEQDKHLVDAVQGGDLDAFSELFRRHYPSVRLACARRLGDAVEADEVAQAAFVRALERIHQCRGERRFGAWVHVIARYLCVDHQRAQARVVPHEAPLSDDHSDGTRPEDRLLEREQHDRVHKAIAELPERQRRAVTARALGLRPGEIAATLGLSIGAVDSLLLRARRRLALTYTSAASEGGAVATTTGTSTTASLGGALAVEPTHVAEGVAAAVTQVASAVGSLPGVRPAGGLVSAVVGAALTFGGGAVGPGTPAEPPTPPPAVTIVTPSGATDPFAAIGVMAVDDPEIVTTVTIPASAPVRAPTTDVPPTADTPVQAQPADETPAAIADQDEQRPPLPPAVSDPPAVEETPSPAPESPAPEPPPPAPTTPTTEPPAPVEPPPDPSPPDEPAPLAPSPDPVNDQPGQRSSGPLPE